MSYNRYPAVGGGGSGTSITIDSTTVTGGTAGSVLFVSSTGKVSQDNSKFFWDETNKRLGIGTATPSTALQVSGGSITCQGAGSSSERFGSGATAGGNNSVAVGNGATAAYLNSTVLGLSATINGADTTGYIVSIGTNAAAYSLGVAIGVQATTSGYNTVAIGYDSTCTSSEGVAVGRSASATIGSVAVGSSAVVSSGSNSFALGRSCTTTGSASVAMGFNVTNAEDFVFRYSLGTDFISTKAPSIALGAVTSTTADVDVFRLITSWATSTHASRKGRTTLNVYDTASREAIRIEASGTEPMVGFYGVAATARQLLATGAGATVDNVITVLQTLGLCKQS